MQLFLAVTLTAGIFLGLAFGCYLISVLHNILVKYHRMDKDMATLLILGIIFGVGLFTVTAHAIYSMLGV